MAYLFLQLYIIIFCIIKSNLKCCETAKSAKLNIMRQKVPIPDKNLLGTTWNTFCSEDTNILCSNFTSYFYFILFVILLQVSSNSSSERGPNVSAVLVIISCLKQFNFRQFLFMSSLCKLSFHPEMEFSFMLKLLLRFCRQSCLKQKSDLKYYFLFYVWYNFFSIIYVFLFLF